MLFCMGVSAFRKKSLIKDGICEVKNNILLCMAYEGSTAKDMEVQCFGFVLQENLLRCSLLEISDKCVIVYVSCSYYYELLLGI